MAGKKGDLEFIINSNPDPAIQSMAKVLAKQEQTIAKLRETNQESRKTQQSFQSMGNPLGRIVKDAAAIGTSIVSVQGAANLAKTAIRGIVEELQTVRRLQGEMLNDTSIPLEQQAQGLASLMPGGINPENMQTSKDMITGLAREFQLNTLQARNAAFFGYSQFGATPAGDAAMRTISKVTATGQLTPEGIRALPGLFGVIGADTEEQQMEAVNKLVQATKGSIAEVPEFIPEFVNAYPTLKRGGFDYQESLAMMVSAVMATAGNVPEAGTRVESALKYSGFPSREGEAYMTDYAESLGLNFEKMQPKERFALTRQAMQQAEREGNIVGFGSAFGNKAMQGFGALFTPQSEQKYYESLDIVRQTDLGMIDREYENYRKLLSAKKNLREAISQELRDKTGSEFSGVTELDEIINTVQEVTKARGEYPISMGLMTEGMEKRGIRNIIIQESLSRAISEAQASGDMQRVQRGKELQNAYNRDLLMLPSRIQEYSEFTHGFENLAGADFKPRYEGEFKMQLFGPALQQYFERMERVLDRQNETLDRLSQNIEEQNRAASIPVPMGNLGG